MPIDHTFHDLIEEERVKRHPKTEVCVGEICSEHAIVQSVCANQYRSLCCSEPQPYVALFPARTFINYNESPNHDIRRHYPKGGSATGSAPFPKPTNRIGKDELFSIGYDYLHFLKTCTAEIPGDVLRDCRSGYVRERRKIELFKY
jgi:hypothetical protein